MWQSIWQCIYGDGDKLRMETLRIVYLSKGHDIMSCFEVSYLLITSHSSCGHLCLWCPAIVLYNYVAGM